MTRAIGINDFLAREFRTFPFEDKWLATFGEPEANFSMLIYGHPKNGKTEFCIQFAKYISQFTKVYFNSVEQGISKTLQDAVKRNHLEDNSGRIVFGNKETYDEMMERLSIKGSPMVVIVDSRDYMNLTARQWFILTERFPRKSFILVCWESANKPASAYAKQISYKVDILVHVKNFMAWPRSRFGGNEKFIIWNRKPVQGEQIAMEGLG